MGNVLGGLFAVYFFGVMAAGVYRLVTTKTPGTQYIEGAYARMLPSLFWGFAWPVRAYRFVDARRR
jgi:hypothetical protein